MFNSLQNLLQSVRPADIFDVLFVSLFLYGVLSWFKTTASRSVLVGISLLAVVYFAARAFDMYLTALLFQGVFAVLMVGLVVVFQEDLRRFFERIAALGTLRERLHSATSRPSFDTLVEVASDLAARRIGALLVIKGHEPLDRHVEGGVVVDGQISKPLLDSIFDPHSMGHDGAAIIENDRVRRFAAHLPLSHNLREIGQRGTRHSAALGLSEVTDALIIVVSEERGRISVAQRGRLTPMNSVTELQRAIDQFCVEVFPQRTDSMLIRLIRENAALKGASLALACLAWVIIHHAGTVQRVYPDVPIEYRNVPNGLIIEDSAPVKARVTLSGFEHAFWSLEPNTLKISLDLAGLSDGVHRISIDDDRVKRPWNLNVDQIEPRAITLSVHTLVTVKLPVEVRTAGRLPAGVKLVGQLKAMPAVVPVNVWRINQGTTKLLFTEPIDLSQLTRSTTITATLVIPADMSLPEGQPREINVAAEIVKEGAGS